MKIKQLTNDELLEMMYNEQLCYNSVEKENRRKKRQRKGYKYN